jgi:transcriptional regulator with XRE-family HTH domain
LITLDTCSINLDHRISQYPRYHLLSEGQLENSAITSEHVRAARMLLRWDQKELARKSGISLPTIKRLESQPGALSAYADTIATIRKTFEDQGIEFFDGDAPGVWLHKKGRGGSQKKAATKSRRQAKKPADRA